MSGITKTKSESSTSSRSARRQMLKTQVMQSKRAASMMASGPVEVLSRPSSSKLAEAYKTEEFRNEWANDVRFHVARNLLHLRRFRKLSQGTVATTMGTSQSAVARIESAQENITLDTLQRLIGALGGRLEISIPPQEYPRLQRHPWWDAPENLPWVIRGWAYRQDISSEQVIIGYERPNNSVMIANTLVAGSYGPLLSSGETEPQGGL
jgi:transcriptional regulator with XRE-family HTH domain